MVFAIDYPSVQILSILSISLFRQLYVLATKPYIDFSLALAVFNEFLVSLYLYFLILITDFNESETLKDAASFGLLSVIAVYMVVNLGIFFYMIVRKVYFKVRRKFCLKKAKPEPSKLEET